LGLVLAEGENSSSRAQTNVRRVNSSLVVKSETWLLVLDLTDYLVYQALRSILRHRFGQNGV